MKKKVRDRGEKEGRERVRVIKIVCNDGAVGPMPVRPLMLVT